jgi:hypothetical protein
MFKEHAAVMQVYKAWSVAALERWLYGEAAARNHNRLDNKPTAKNPTRNSSSFWLLASPSCPANNSRCHQHQSS